MEYLDIVIGEFIYSVQCAGNKLFHYGPFNLLYTCTSTVAGWGFSCIT